MNDPHVAALFYDIEHSDSVSYEKAKSFVHDEPAFRVKVKDKKVCFKLKEHYATESEARESVKEYIHIWELENPRQSILYSKKVLNRVSQFSSTKGGSLEARKREGINDDLTAQERSFLQEAVKK